VGAHGYEASNFSLNGVPPSAELVDSKYSRGSQVSVLSMHVFDKLGPVRGLKVSGVAIVEYSSQL
jgi:hypothetical protein